MFMLITYHSFPVMHQKFQVWISPLFQFDLPISGNSALGRRDIRDPWNGVQRALTGRVLFYAERFPRFLLERNGCAYMCIYCICIWCNLTYCANTSFRLVRIRCISEESCATAELCFPMCRSRWRWLRDSPRVTLWPPVCIWFLDLHFCVEMCGQTCFWGFKVLLLSYSVWKFALPVGYQSLTSDAVRLLAFTPVTAAARPIVSLVFFVRDVPPTDIENTPNFEERLQDLMESLNEGIVSAAEVQGGRKRRREEVFYWFFLGVVLEKDTLTCRIILSKKHMYSHMYLQDSTSKLGGPSKIMTIK